MYGPLPPATPISERRGALQECRWLEPSHGSAQVSGRARYTYTIIFTLRFRKRTPLVALWPGRVMGPPQAHSMGSLGGPIAGPESLPPPCMASVARSDADLPPAITTSDAQPDLNVSPPMSATLVEANVQISRVEALVSSLRQQVAA